MPIIKSLLDTDLYKLTMMQAVLHQFPDKNVRYQFKSRGKQKLGSLAGQVRQEIKAMGELRFQPDELRYLSGLRFFSSDFIDFLRIFRFNTEFVKVEDIEGDLSITIEGPWLHTILYEVPILAIVSEIEGRRQMALDTLNLNSVWDEGVKRLEKKLDLLVRHPRASEIKFVDFGTRRRFSAYWQEHVLVRILMWQNKNKISPLIGTSNVFLAMKYALKPIGTMAHEWLQAGQAMNVRLDHSQKFMLETWCQEYRGDLGIALTDVISMDAFLKDFDLYLAKLFDGCRHDSGCPFVWCRKLIDHYRSLGIDPLSKSAVFSDGLDFGTMLSICDAFYDQIRVSFGIGTNLTNDVGLTPLKIVMKIVECDGRPVAKISDSPGKGMCEDAEFVQHLRKVYGLDYDFTSN